MFKDVMACFLFLSFIVGRWHTRARFCGGEGEGEGEKIQKSSQFSEIYTSLPSRIKLRERVSSVLGRDTTGSLSTIESIGIAYMLCLSDVSTVYYGMPSIQSCEEYCLSDLSHLLTKTFQNVTVDGRCLRTVGITGLGMMLTEECTSYSCWCRLIEGSSSSQWYDWCGRNRLTRLPPRPLRKQLWSVQHSASDGRRDVVILASAWRSWQQLRVWVG